MLLVAVALCLVMASGGEGSAAESKPAVMVFAGSASQPPLEEAARMFEEQTGIRIVLQFGGSGAMLSQIRLTGQGDLYIPGSPDYLEKAVELQLVEGEAVILAYLVPAIIVPKGNPKRINGLDDLARTDLRVGIADPDGVCVGLYAVEILDANRLMARVRPNLHGMVESCAKVASMVPLGTADAVLGWREFAAWNPDAMEAVLLAPEQVPRLAYVPAIKVRGTRNPQGAEEFVRFLRSPAGQALFEKWGYFTRKADVRPLAPMAGIGGVYPLSEGW
jgi:molybdate transport system substrate-binding protein